MSFRTVILLLLCLSALTAAPFSARAEYKLPYDKVPYTPKPYQPNKLHEYLTDGTSWLNVSRNLTKEDLAGRMLLLDFWTYCCINCQQIIPDLKFLEKKFGKDLTVIGVHSAKFANEKDADAIRQAIQRYGIEHPVINDDTFKVWKSYGVNAWPTLVLITPGGSIAGSYSGEGHLKEMVRDISKMQHDYKDYMVRTDLPIALEKDKLPDSILRFPGKLEVIPELEGKPALVISDSGNNRILIVNKEGTILKSFGSGIAGLKDGAASSAQFNHPQGIAYRKGMLYVADTENHALRSIDIATGAVTTLMGTGQKGFMRMLTETASKSFALASPWDVAFFPDDEHLAVAMAGSHQLWSYDIASGKLQTIAGSGAEYLVDGIFPGNSLAQPSGLYPYGDKLYFVDAETSSLRVMAKKDNDVTTLVGKGLFDFGYVEGDKEKARMQHPLGVYADESGVYVADAYNHSLRRYDMKTHTLTNFAGTGKSGAQDGTRSIAQFNEPNDIARIEGTLYIADTNNHRIRTLDVASGKVGELAVMPQPEQAAPALSDFLPNMSPLPDTKLKAGVPTTLHLNFNEGWKLNKEAPSWLALFDDKGAVLQSFTRDELTAKNPELKALPDNSRARLQGTFYYCQDKAGSQCLIQSFDGSVESTPGGAASLVLPLH